MWVLPGIAPVAAVAIVCAGLVKHLPPRTRKLFVLAGALYFGGAIGVEMVSAEHAHAYSENNLGYAMIITIQELFEMSGVIVLIYALLDYLRADVLEIHVALARSHVAQQCDRDITISAGGTRASVNLRFHTKSQHEHNRQLQTAESESSQSKSSAG